MGPPKKRSKGSPRYSSSDTGGDDSMSASEEEAIELALHDRVLGQHAGELLLDLHWKYGKYQEKKFEDGKKINMLGMIVDGTLVSYCIACISILLTTQSLNAMPFIPPTSLGRLLKKVVSPIYTS